MLILCGLFIIIILIIIIIIIITEESNVYFPEGSQTVPACTSVKGSALNKVLVSGSLGFYRR